VRHSWRADYNFPDPVKLQGRYIMYFGPLFLISAFSFFGKSFTPQKLGLSKAILIALSATLVIFSYAVLFEGFIWLDGALGASVNSPYGSLMRTMKIWYVALTLACAGLSVVLIGKKKSLQAAALALFLIAFYLYGNVRIYDRILTSRQLLNAHIHNLLQVIEPYIPEAEQRAAIRLEIPAGSETRVIRSWREALNFAGYTENELVESAELGADPQAVFQADYAGHVFSLRKLTAEEYAQAAGYTFTHSGYFYEFEELAAE